MGTDINVSMDEGPPVWVFFLVFIQFIEAMDYAARFRTIKLLLTYDPHLCASQGHILSAFEHVSLYSKTILSMFPGAGVRERAHGIIRATRSTLVPRLAQIHPEMVDMPLEKGYSTFMQVLRCLAPDFGVSAGLSLFSEADLAELDALVSKKPAAGKRQRTNLTTSERGYTLVEDDADRPCKLIRTAF